MKKVAPKKVALITGGSRGIGLAMVERFKRDGWSVSACATKIGNLKNAPADLKQACDVRDLKQVRKTIAATVEKFGQIDVVINNAGLAGTNPMEPDASDEFWHQIIDVNLHGTYYFCKYSLPHLKDGSGKIINIASVLAFKGVPDGIAYCAAKHGVLGLTRALSHYAAPRKITVNTICPGWTRTDMAQERMKEIGINESALNKAVPLGRFIEPDEVAGLAAYLASDAAGGITGQAFTIDGGVLA